MRLVLLVLLAGAIVSGCATPGGATRSTSQVTKAPVTAGDKVLTDQTQPERPEVRADSSVGGKIASVNPTLRFVVMDFPLRRMPAFEQRLNVYRRGQKVGEVKVTGPTLETTIAGDITTGEAQIGDEVRED